jgi:chromosomal replication initiator protein
MTILSDDARAIFDRAVAHTRALSPATFDQWFGGVQFDDLTDGVLTLRVQNEFVLEWVKTNFLPTLTDKIRELSGWSVQVAWTIDPNLMAPVSRCVQIPPVRPRALVVRPSSASVMTEPKEPPVIRRASPPPEDINPKHTFASFVTGLGKTHLMHAIAHRVHDERPAARIIYVSAERFTNDFIGAIQHHRMDDFRAKYRSNCDVLLVDDIQFLAGREQTQEEFFHTFNALHAVDRQIVVTSDKYPQNLERMEERLVSRFSWGLIADIQVPELETRVAIVRNKAALEGFALDDDVALFLAQMIRSNVRELEGTLIRLAAKSSLTGRPVDIAFARAEVSAALPNLRAATMSVEDIQRAVCHHFHLRSIDLTSKDRHKSIAFARHVAMYLCKQRLKCSFPEIGRAFGNRDHTTVMSAVRKIEAQRDSDPQVRAHIEALERKLADE